MTTAEKLNRLRAEIARVAPANARRFYALAKKGWEGRGFTYYGCFGRAAGSPFGKCDLTGAILIGAGVLSLDNPTTVSRLPLDTLSSLERLPMDIRVALDLPISPEDIHGLQNLNDDSPSYFSTGHKWRVLRLLKERGEAAE